MEIRRTRKRTTGRQTEDGRGGDGRSGGGRGDVEEERGVFKCELVLMSLVRVWNSLFKAAIILINVVNEPLIAVMDLTLQLTTTYTPIDTHAHTNAQGDGEGGRCMREDVYEGWFRQKCRHLCVRVCEYM